MSIHEIKIYLDLNPESKPKVLDRYAKKFDLGYFFVDSEDGRCYLFDRYGKEKDISVIHDITEDMIPINIEKIVIPNNMTRIGSYAFSWCKRLTSVTIPNSVTSIEYAAFRKCSSLTNVTIPNSVTNIEYWVFEYCSKLKSLIFKNKTIKQVKSIKSYPFGLDDESVIKVELS